MLDEARTKELIESALQQLPCAYVPYSHFHVGAALLAKNGTVYTGCNIENASYGASNCAERTAVFKAVSEGKKEFLKIAIMSSGRGFTFPCGICRQVLWEFMPQGDVVLGDVNGRIKVFKLKELLPEAFSL